MLLITIFCDLLFTFSMLTCIKSALSYLGHEVELDHSVGEGFRVGPQAGDEAQHGAVERPVDLCERLLAWVVHIHLQQSGVFYYFIIIFSLIFI